MRLARWSAIRCLQLHAICRSRPGLIASKTSYTLFARLGYRYLKTNYIDHYFTNLPGATLRPRRRWCDILRASCWALVFARRKTRAE